MKKGARGRHSACFEPSRTLQHDRIQEVLFNSGAVRVLDRSAASFDYIMKSEITDIVTRSSDGQKLVDYTMKIKLYNLDGELVGQWSDDLSLFKSR